MAVLLRILRYLIPSKGNIMLVVVVSMLTSLFSIVSIYSILPLLNTVFTSGESVTMAGHASSTGIPEGLGVKPAQSAVQTSPPAAQDTGRFSFKRDTKALKVWAMAKYQSLFSAETKERMLLKICFFLISAFALKNIFVYINQQLIFRIQSKTAKKLRDDIFANIIEMPLAYFHKNKVGNLMNYVYNDVENVDRSISTTLVNFLQNPFSIFVYVAVLLALSWKLTLFAVGSSLVIFFFISLIGNSIKGHAQALQERLSDMNSVLQEKFNGIKLIKATSFEDVELRKFKAFTDDFRKTTIRIFRLRDLTGPLNETLLIGAIAMVLWFGGLQVFAGVMTANELLVFAFTLYSVMGPLKMVGNAHNSLQIGRASAERIFEVLDTEPTLLNGTNPLTAFRDAIRFENVSFKYRREADAPYVLDGVSFEIKKGDTVALIGQSGSGKSTVADLLMRFYDVDSGRITIDGIDIRELDYKQLRRMIGVVSQEVVLFNDTIEHNIAYGVHETVQHERIEEAARLANAHGFISDKPDGYNTLIGDRGIQLSGGQRQRLAIARAMVKNPELLIFDEATSALDNESEKVVQDAIDHAMEHRSSLVIAHRLSTVKNASRIIVMERGKVVESGTHQELLAMNGAYRNLYDLQFNQPQP
ncbi:ABC transporter ATP-binding protein [Chlorobium sp. N1]|uniref:ABC transporter ATP-binding protein n=1 Tax=Chlorobium sp. N1 TaxID=2491138 RepID=UPI00103EF190|nr:ABC transporter ATP-binding protein [Chlorobium sp. N1]TCD48930.1 ABC transporter ATP-binding protein [Chlorobium sp. N1]